jgi:hypothetical protein
MKRVATVGVLVALTLGLSVWAGSQRANAGVLKRTLTSSRLVLGGRVRCTATVKSDVQAGQALSVKLVVHNNSKRAVKYSSWVFDSGVGLKAADGTTYVSDGDLVGVPVPPPLPATIRRGATLTLRRIAIPVRWGGPLQITPNCLGVALPVLRVHVSAPWPRPDQSAVVDEVVAASAHLLDHCRPQTPGFPVSGQIDPPSGDAPPLSAQCSLSISREGTFLVAQVLVLSPPGLAGVQIFQPYETLWPTGRFPLELTSSPPYEAIAWEFVVTKDKAIPVAAATMAASNSSSQLVPFFTWNGSGWRAEGTAPCGGTGFAWGGRGPDLDFISACSA